MKKIPLILFALISPAISFAMTKVDLTKDVYMCNKIILTNKITETFLMENCKNVKLKLYTNVSNGIQVSNVKTNGAIETKTTRNLHSEVKFYTDTGNFMKCYFEVDKLEGCEVDES